MVIQGVDGSAVQLDGMSLVLDASLLILDAEITEIDDVLINQQYADIASLDTRSVVLGGGVHASGDFDINAEWIGSVQAGMVHAGAMHTYVDAQDLDWVIGDKVETLTFHARFNAMMATDPSHGLSVELLNADGSFVFETDITSSLEGVDQQGAGELRFIAPGNITMSSECGSWVLKRTSSWLPTILSTGQPRHIRSRPPLGP